PPGRGTEQPMRLVVRVGDGAIRGHEDHGSVEVIDGPIEPGRCSRHRVVLQSLIVRSEWLNARAVERVYPYVRAFLASVPAKIPDRLNARRNHAYRKR